MMKSKKTTLELKLDKVHKERLSRIKDDVYFACADFKNSDGVIYDLDIFMEGASVDELTVNEVIVHKQDGKARYGWKYNKRKDVWRQD